MDKLRWSSQIKINGKKKHLEYFNNDDDAAGRYNEEAVKLFGECACLNEVPLSQEGCELGQVKRVSPCFLHAFCCSIGSEVNTTYLKPSLVFLALTFLKH